MSREVSVKGHVVSRTQKISGTPFAKGAVMEIFHHRGSLHECAIDSIYGVGNLPIPVSAVSANFRHRSTSGSHRMLRGEQSFPRRNRSTATKWDEKIILIQRELSTPLLSSVRKDHLPPSISSSQYGGEDSSPPVWACAKSHPLIGSNPSSVLGIIFSQISHTAVPSLYLRKGPSSHGFGSSDR